MLILMVTTEAPSTFQTVYEAPNIFLQENITAAVFLLSLQQWMTKYHLEKILKVNGITESPWLFLYVQFRAWEKQ